MDFSKLFHNPFIMEHTPDISEVQWIIVRTVGFVLVALVVVKWIWPTMIQPHLNQRKQDIIDTASQIETTLSETDAMRADYQSRLEKIEDEAKARLEDAVHEAETLRGQIIAEGETSAQAILRRSEEEVLRERAKSLLSMKRAFIEDVIGAAHHAAEVGLDGAAHSRLVDEFVGRLGAAN